LLFIAAAIIAWDAWGSWRRMAPAGGAPEPKPVLAGD
jgi:hypothetical protein